jgi:hypothetical protein
MSVPTPDSPVRLQLKCSNTEDFIERFAPNVTRGGIFLPSRELRDVGAVIRFELALADERVVFAGVGVVTWAKPKGMGVKFTALDPESAPILERLLVRRQLETTGSSAPDDAPKANGVAADATPATSANGAPHATPATSANGVAPLATPAASVNGTAALATPATSANGVAPHATPATSANGTAPRATSANGTAALASPAASANGTAAHATPATFAHAPTAASAPAAVLASRPAPEAATAPPATSANESTTARTAGKKKSSAGLTVAGALVLAGLAAAAVLGRDRLGLGSGPATTAITASTAAPPPERAPSTATMPAAPPTPEAPPPVPAPSAGPAAPSAPASSAVGGPAAPAAAPPEVAAADQQSPTRAAPARTSDATPAPARTAAPATPARASGVRIESLLVGPDYKRFTCPDPTRRFSLRSHKTVNVCLQIEHPPKTDRLALVWERNGTFYGKTPVEVPATRPSFRTRAHMKIGEGRLGSWTVRVVSERNVTLAQAAFDIER